MESLSLAVCSFKTVQDCKGAVFMGHAVATCSLYLGILKSDWIFALKFVSGYFTLFITVSIITMPNMLPVVTFQCATFSSTLHIYASLTLHFMGAAN